MSLVTSSSARPYQHGKAQGETVGQEPQNSRRRRRRGSGRGEKPLTLASLDASRPIPIPANGCLRTTSSRHSYVCRKCGATFRLKTLLKIHDDVHHLKLKRFECDRCFEAFVSKTRLRRHERRKHEETTTTRKSNVNTAESSNSTKIQIQTTERSSKIENAENESGSGIATADERERATAAEDIKDETDFFDIESGVCIGGFFASESKILDEEVEDGEVEEAGGIEIIDWEATLKSEADQGASRRPGAASQRPGAASEMPSAASEMPSAASEMPSAASETPSAASETWRLGRGASSETPAQVKTQSIQHPLTNFLFRRDNIDLLDAAQVSCVFKMFVSELIRYKDPRRFGPPFPLRIDWKDQNQRPDFYPDWLPWHRTDRPPKNISAEVWTNSLRWGYKHIYQNERKRMESSQVPTSRQPV